MGVTCTDFRKTKTVDHKSIFKLDVVIMYDIYLDLFLKM